MPRETNAVLKTKTARTVLDRLEDMIGGREALIDTVALSNLDKKQEYFLRLLCDPARKGDSLVTIARDCGLLPVHILELYRSSAFAKAQVLAMSKFAEALPEIAQDIAEKSVDAKVECPRCFGEGFEAEGVTCTQCTGKGLVFRASDLDRQKLSLEAVGVIKKGPGVNVNVQQNVAVGNAGGFFSKYVKASDDTAYDVSDMVDGEVKE